MKYTLPVKIKKNIKLLQNLIHQNWQSQHQNGVQRLENKNYNRKYLKKQKKTRQMAHVIIPLHTYTWKS